MESPVYYSYLFKYNFTMILRIVKKLIVVKLVVEIYTHQLKLYCVQCKLYNFILKNMHEQQI